MKRKISYIFILLSLLVVSCNLDLYTQPPGQSGDNYIPPKQVVFDPTDSPSTPYATKGYYTDRINISWEEVEGADYYSIEKAKVSLEGAAVAESDWVSIPESIYGNKYSDKKNLEDGVFYAYRISAHSNSVQDASIPSEICYGTKLSPVQTLTASKGESTTVISLNWEQMPGVKSYKIYASNDLDFSESEYCGSKNQIQDTSKSNTNSFDYHVADFTDKPAGSTVYFCIKSVGEKDTSSFSPVQSGYSLVIGAPQEPKVLSTTTGDSVDSITIKWKKDIVSSGDKMDYSVMRSSAGSSESVILSTADGDTLQEDGDSYVLVDTMNLKPNTEYNYSIVSKNSVGQSTAAKTNGYILSSPYDLAVSADTTAYEYKLQLTMPIGAEEHKDTWMYEVTTTKRNGNTPDPELYTYENLLAFYTSVEAVPTDAEYQEEVASIKVVTVNGELKSDALETSTVSISGIPEIPTDLSASAYKNTSFLPNSNGVGPIELSWSLSGSDPASTYKITRSDGRAFETNATTDNIYYDNADTVIGEKYKYTIEARDLMGRSKNASDWSDYGYGVISPEVFIRNFQAHLLKPWEYPAEHPEYVSGNKSSIWGYISQAGMGSLGSATVSGTYGGSVTYSAKAEGFGGNVSFSYADGFSEAPYFALDGNCSYTMHVSMSGSGSVDPTTFKTKGMYIAEIKFDKLSVSNQKFTGKYVVTFKYSNENVTVEVKP